VGKKEPSYTAGGNVKLVQPFWKTIWKLLSKLNIDLPYDPAISLLGIYPKECDSGYYKGTCTPMFIAVLFTIAKLWKQPRRPTTDDQELEASLDNIRRCLPLQQKKERKKNEM
jgi:hypothetical protein